MGKRIPSIIRCGSESSIAIITDRGKLKKLEPPKIKRSRKSVMQRSIIAANKEARLLAASSAQVSTGQTNSSAPVTNENSFHFGYDCAADHYKGDNNNNKIVMKNTIRPPRPTKTSLRLISLYTRAERKDIEWENLFPQLRKAYLRGLDLHPIDTTKLDLVQTRRCNCEVMDTNKVTCIFKCGIIHNIHVSSCKSCEGFSLPLILMESHMVPSSPLKPQIAVHINVMDSYLRQLEVFSHQSITSIAKVVAAEFSRTVPRSYKSILAKILPIYAKMKNDH